MAAALTVGLTCRAATMKSAGVRAIRMPRAPTPIVRNITTVIAATAAISVIGGRPVDAINELDELPLEPRRLAKVEPSDEQYRREHSDAEHDECQRKPEHGNPGQRWPDSAQNGEGRGHGQGERQAHE